MSSLRAWPRGSQTHPFYGRGPRGQADGRPRRSFEGASSSIVRVTGLGTGDGSAIRSDLSSQRSSTYPWQVAQDKHPPHSASTAVMLFWMAPQHHAAALWHIDSPLAAILQHINDRWHGLPRISTGSDRSANALPCSGSEQTFDVLIRLPARRVQDVCGWAARGCGPSLVLFATGYEDPTEGQRCPTRR
jgi:hypothetical protein